MNFWEYLDRHWVVAAFAIFFGCCGAYDVQANIAKILLVRAQQRGKLSDRLEKLEREVANGKERT